MKNLFKNPIFYVASWFAIIFFVATMVTSCGVHYVQCDAYGSNTIDTKKPRKANIYETTYEIMTPGRAEYLSSIKDK